MNATQKQNTNTNILKVHIFIEVIEKEQGGIVQKQTYSYSRATSIVHTRWLLACYALRCRHLMYYRQTLWKSRQNKQWTLPEVTSCWRRPVLDHRAFDKGSAVWKATLRETMDDMTAFRNGWILLIVQVLPQVFNHLVVLLTKNRAYGNEPCFIYTGSTSSSGFRAHSFRPMNIYMYIFSIHTRTHTHTHTHGTSISCCSTLSWKGNVINKLK